MAVYRRVLLVVDLTDDSLAIGRKAQALAAALGAEVELLHVVEFVRVARERHADLIVLGSRERHGLSILVNLTEDTVLHAAPCDVLAMRTRL